MFNFHKPRTYRSTEGCCICKAKSSSSRFTDSRKHEKEAMKCFDLKYPRQGEICNACILLIKRFKRLPLGSKRNWSHIVDAKAGIGPGYNKIQTKIKSERINSKTAQQKQENASSSISANTTNNNSTTSVASSSSINGLYFVPEKFSKIFKKSKKLKEPSSHNSKRKSTNNGWSQNNTNSLPATPDSMDSDYEDSRLVGSLSGNPGGSSVVEFQTQTRASAYKAQVAAEARIKIIKMGAKRRKCLPPRKYCRSMAYEESLTFFDVDEWRECKSCCGIYYECLALGGALILDTAKYKYCEQHQKQNLSNEDKKEKPTITAASFKNIDNKKITTLPFQKPIMQTTPTVVQLQPPQRSNNFSNNSFKTATTTTVTPTPVLKKHHLFFKRQSECFPQGDIITTTTNAINGGTNSSPVHVENYIKTESEQNLNHLYHNRQQQSNTTLQRHIEHAIHSNSLTNPPNTILSDSFPSLAMSISVTKSSSQSPSSSSLTPASSSGSIMTMPQMPKHSLAKVTTISPHSTTSVHHTQHHHYNTSSNSNMVLTKPNTYLQKVKSDSGKTAKHSLEKFNTAVKLKGSDINEIKPIIRTVDKSCILAKSPPQANIISINSSTTATAAYQSLTPYNQPAGQQPRTTTSPSSSSPTSSTSLTASNNKFSDNSSDSGFDENVLDRKSASPLQEDCEKKMLTRPVVQTMFLASGVQIQGQPQNLVLTGNEVASKILQNRKYGTVPSGHISANPRSLSANHHNSTKTAVKIAQISTVPQISSSATNSVGPPISMSSAGLAKMRAIYNNANLIEHENGITTIVPASSLAASTQTAAMQNIAPSTVTITPAPPLRTQFNQQNVISRKLTTANLINLQGNTTISNSLNNTSGNHLHHHLSSCSSNNIHNNNTNQKIILLKTSPNNTTVTASANYNTTTGGVQQHLGNNGGGR